jgi:hypothetical protein
LKASCVPWLYALVPGWWRVYKEAHPDATPPAGYSWLNDPESPRHPTARLLRPCRKVRGRGQPMSDRAALLVLDLAAETGALADYIALHELAVHTRGITFVAAKVSARCDNA